jgi:small subunit ribosomal protein S5
MAYSSVDRRRRPEMVPEEKQFDERTLHIDRVARVVKGGRRFRFRALVVVGDRKTKVGIGLSKGADVSAAVTKATEVAKKQMISVPLYKGTLPHEVESKVGGAKILLKPASKGTGLIAGGVVRSVLEVAGVHDALSKSLGSSNKANIAYATIEALQNLVPANQWITRKNQASVKTVVKPKAASEKSTGSTKKSTKKVSSKEKSS